jgi:hypothetical protein
MFDAGLSAASYHKDNIERTNLQRFWPGFLTMFGSS